MCYGPSLNTHHGTILTCQGRTRSKPHIGMPPKNTGDPTPRAHSRESIKHGWIALVYRGINPSPDWTSTTRDTETHAKKGKILQSQGKAGADAKKKKATWTTPKNYAWSVELRRGNEHAKEGRHRYPTAVRRLLGAANLTEQQRDLATPSKPCIETHTHVSATVELVRPRQQFCVG